MPDLSNPPKQPEPPNYWKNAALVMGGLLIIILLAKAIPKVPIELIVTILGIYGAYYLYNIYSIRQKEPTVSAAISNVKKEALKLGLKLNTEADNWFIIPYSVNYSLIYFLKEEMTWYIDNSNRITGRDFRHPSEIISQSEKSRLLTKLAELGRKEAIEQ